MIDATGALDACSGFPVDRTKVFAGVVFASPRFAVDRLSVATGDELAGRGLPVDLESDFAGVVVARQDWLKT
jgi:hypothetical protein